jgi:hypothetical protein
MFLDQYNIGKVQETPSAILLQFGHTEHSAAETEILTYKLVKKFEVGELPSLATAYLLRCGYAKVTSSSQLISPSLVDGNLATCPSFEQLSGDVDLTTCIGFDNMCIITAEDDNLPTIIIVISYCDKLASFSKHVVA